MEWIYWCQCVDTKAYKGPFLDCVCFKQQLYLDIYTESFVNTKKVTPGPPGDYKSATVCFNAPRLGCIDYRRVTIMNKRRVV